MICRRIYYLFSYPWWLVGMMRRHPDKSAFLTLAFWSRQRKFLLSGWNMLDRN